MTTTDTRIDPLPTTWLWRLEPVAGYLLELLAAEEGGSGSRPIPGPWRLYQHAGRRRT